MALDMLALWLCFMTLTSALIPPPLPAASGNIQLELPAIYVFGDSYVESGNNRFLPTKSKANYLPYGIDFGGMPTGRASNGRVVVDFIAQAAGLPFPPPMLGMSEADRTKTITGVNYASVGSGIQPAPPKAEQLFGHVLSLSEQVSLFKNTTVYLKNEFDNEESFASYLSKSLFFVHTATNDLGLFWDFEKNSTADEKYPRLLSALSKQLKTLYQLGGRLFFVNNVSPLGCQPFNLITFKPKTACYEALNMRSSGYNKLLPGLLADMEASLADSKFILGDIFKLFEDIYSSPNKYGILNIRDSCCIYMKGNGVGPCAPNLKPCPDRKTYAFFDPFHISEVMHSVWARMAMEELDHL